MYLDHRNLDQVSRRALDRRIRRHALAKGAHVVVPLLELGDVATTVEQRLHISLRFGLHDTAIEERLHPREALEIRVDKRLRLDVRQLELPRQGVRPLPVDRGEVDRLRARAHLASHLGQLHAEDDRGRLPVDITACFKRRHERRITRQMRQQTQFDL